jgi:hypothetical protein
VQSARWLQNSATAALGGAAELGARHAAEGFNGLDWMLLLCRSSCRVMACVCGGMVVLESYGLRRAGGICPQPSDLPNTPHRSIQCESVCLVSQPLSWSAHRTHGPALPC